MVSTGISAVGAKRATKNTQQAISTLPDNEITWEMDHFLCTSYENTLCQIFWQFVDNYCVSTGIYAIWSQKSPQKHITGNIYPSGD